MSLGFIHKPRTQRDQFIGIWCPLQVRALTREVGSLKEDLRREIKRRERATAAAREAEETKLDCENRVKQLEYCKRYVSHIVGTTSSTTVSCIHTRLQEG